MNYEEKYKEALDLMKDCVPDENGLVHVHPEDIFTELRKSEDEKVRKVLINIFATHKDYEMFFGASVEDIRAWLEKQGHTDGIIEKAKTEKQRVIITETNGNANIDWDTRSLADTKMLLEYGLDFINKKFEKQGEQKSFDYENATIVPKDFAPKEEPKFHEGDWVVLTAGELSTTLQIVNVDTNKKLYWFNDSSYLPIVDEECLHLWSIQDIKDGDVLVVGDEDGTGTAICGKNDDLGNNILYCYYDDENGFAINTPIALACLLHPATKEQRELLFQKMHEEGYEWNAEKKELKKIEQKPTEWSLPYGKK